MYVIILVITLIATFYLYVTKKHSYWKDRDVPCEKPLFFVGNMWETFMIKKHFGQVCEEIYRKYVGYKYVGFYKFLAPAVILRDPELVKNVLIKDFSHFDRNDVQVDPNVDVIFGKHPFVIYGPPWKHVRAQLAPNFTNVKMRAIYPLVEDVSKRLVNYINKKIEKDEANCLEAKDICLKFTTENVANCVFGLNAQAFEEGQSEFVRIAKDLGNVSFLTGVKMLLITMFPEISKILKVSFFEEKTVQYFLGVIRETTDYRKTNNIVRNDVLDMLNNLKNSSDFTEIDVMAHAAGFFGDGVDSSASVLSYILFELSSNLEVQRKLQKQIDSAMINGKLSFEDLQKIGYLDDVMNEAMRKNSTVLTMSRICTKDYKFPHPKHNDGPEVTIKKGTVVIISTAGLQEDEMYFQNADKFLPERFTNQDPITKGTFLPFSDGPRVCMGTKFGMLQLKVALVGLLHNFDIKLHEKTQVPLKILEYGLIRSAVGGIWIEITKRK